MKKILFLDDFRNPFAGGQVHLPPKLDGEDEEVIWVKNYNEFKAWITKNGLPDHVCLDHDLAVEHYHDDMYNGMAAYNKHYATFKEKTGREAAMFLVTYCSQKKLPLPKWSVHSQNPVGKENIKMILLPFTKK
jgi:hypothetical protein